VKKETTQHSGPRTLSSLRWEIVALLSALIIVVAPLLYLAKQQLSPPPEKQQVGSIFRGSASCQTCHKSIYAKWQNSHHDLAMDIATKETVEGDFDNSVYTDPYNQVTSRFYTREGKYYAETEGPDGALGEFEITHTFGVYPLQQYLVPFPGGRLQCLPIAWDVELQQWYRLPPYEVEGPTDWLHWTRGGQNWNSMCAECHSTRLTKGYDQLTDSYSTSWFEIDVGCEACHGPGSTHIAWAERPAFARVNKENYGLEVQTANLTPQKQIAICAPCHSRRFQLGDNLHTEERLLDKMVPSLLDEGLYYPDGQILEEVYVYGSYTQSKMYNSGVRCSDCHDVHSLNVYHKDNQLCLQCHRAKVYDTASHHFHKKIYEGKPSDGALCISCHMPGKRYMGIDYRRDHSIRVPRPDLSRSLGTPNSCSTKACHGDKPLDWVIENYTKWYGESRKPHYGTALAAGQDNSPGAAEELAGVAADPLLPAIVRATAFSLLRNYPSEASLALMRQALEDENDLIRYTAIRSLGGLDDKTKVELIGPKLYDPVKAVRLEAAINLSTVPRQLLRKADLDAFDARLVEYREAMEYNSDFAAQRYNLGNLEANLGNDDKAVAYYTQAIEIDDQFFPAKVNLAMQYTRMGDNVRAEQLFREVVADNPELYEASYSLGLLLAENNNYKEAAEFLGKAAEAMPGYTRARYNQALALFKIEEWQAGEEALLAALEVEPDNAEYFVTLANIYLRLGMVDKARNLAEQTLEMFPDHARARELLQILK
jgi:tetratricopeptide (TPR) repeat protein